MFNEKKTLNLYTSVESYNNSTPDIVIDNVLIDEVRDGILTIKDTDSCTHIINLREFVAVVF